MSTEGEPKQPKAKPAVAPAPRAEGRPPLDERRLKFAELQPYGKEFTLDELLERVRDGRAIVRANAALVLAAGGHVAPPLVTLVRDSETSVALAAAEAFARLGSAARPLVPGLVAAMAGTQPEVTEALVAALSRLVGVADEELTIALDVPLEVVMRSVVDACGKLGKQGVAFLISAAQHERSKIRVNAIAGLGHLGKADVDAAMAALAVIEGNDPVPDIRAAAKKAMLAVVARENVKQAADALPKHIPDFEARKLSASELAEYTDKIDVAEMLVALQDGRNHVKINGARGLAAIGAKGGPAAKDLGLLLRDSTPAVRLEAGKALGKLGSEAVAAAPDLVGALGDADDDVAEAAATTLAAMGTTAQDALVRGLESGSESGGRRVGELVGKLPDASKLLTEAFKSPAVNVQVNAALGLGLLGRDRVGAGLAALHGARTGGDARTREAVRRALDMIEPRGQAGPKSVAAPGFEDQFMAIADLEKHKAELERVGVADFTMYLQDGRDVVRANAAYALCVIAGVGAARSLGVLLRDDSARVRLAAAQTLDKLGDAAVVETADDIVGALRDADDKVAAACGAALRARRGKMVGALVRGLETGDPRHGQRIVEVIGALPDASEILCEAFESPAVNVQVNAALGLGLLGTGRVGKGRKALEGARTGGDARTREAVRKAIDTLDGPRSTGPEPVAVDGFEDRVLEAAAFANAGGKLRVDDLVAYLQDGRAVVRANSAIALASLGAAAAPALQGLGVLMRDDDKAVRIAAAAAIDKLGDDAVREVAAYLVGALRGDADVGKAVSGVLGARKAKVLGALVKGLETDDDAHARRILELVNALPDACEILCDAFESPAENVQVNAAIGIGMLGEKRAGTAGKKKLEGARTGGFARTREAVFKALAMLKQ